MIGSWRVGEYVPPPLFQTLLLKWQNLPVYNARFEGFMIASLHDFVGADEMLLRLMLVIRHSIRRMQQYRVFLVSQRI